MFIYIPVFDTRMLRVKLNRHTENVHKIKMHTFDPEIIGGDFYIYSLIYTLSRVNYWSYFPMTSPGLTSDKYTSTLLTFNFYNNL